MVALELYDKFLYAVSPFAAATALLGSIYCSACVYGAVTVCQVLGQDEGKQAIEVCFYIFWRQKKVVQLSTRLTNYHNLNGESLLTDFCLHVLMIMLRMLIR